MSRLVLRRICKDVYVILEENGVACRQNWIEVNANALYTAHNNFAGLICRKPRLGFGLPAASSD